MATKHDIRDKLAEHNGPADEGHATWVREKIARALEEAEDPSRMTPVEQVWREFGFED